MDICKVVSLTLTKKSVKRNNKNSEKKPLVAQGGRDFFFFTERSTTRATLDFWPLRHGGRVQVPAVRTECGNPLLMKCVLA